jgi:hypothetical protein
MNIPRFPLIFAVISLTLPIHRFAQADDLRMSAIASYTNSGQAKKDGERALIILDEHKIRADVSCSFGCTICVWADKAIEARKLLAVVIKKEGLRLTLTRLNSKGTRYETLTPESVLKTDQRP